MSRDGQKLTTNVVSRGFSFARNIDGIESRNSGGFTIVFGSHEKIQRLTLSWRSLLPYESCSVLTPKEIIGLIRQGQTIIPRQRYDVTGIDQAAKLTVTDVSLRYFDNIGHKPLDLSYPFAAIKVSADLHGTNTAEFYLECPVLADNVSKDELQK